MKNIKRKRDNDYQYPYSVPNPTVDELAARKRWVALLRSGKYKKHRGALGNPSDTSRCCLGVACDQEVTGFLVNREVDLNNSQILFNEEKEFLPTTVRKALGIVSNGPRVQLNTRSFRLSSLNDSTLGDDGAEYSHKEIADLIENTYITPFEGKM